MDQGRAAVSMSCSTSPQVVHVQVCELHGQPCREPRYHALCSVRDSIGDHGCGLGWA